MGEGTVAAVTAEAVTEKETAATVVATQSSLHQEGSRILKNSGLKKNYV